MEGKRKRKASLLSLELGVAKTGFICEQSTDADSYNAEEDGVRGGRMKPLASLEVNRHLPLVDSLQGGLANSSITKKTVSPSAVCSLGRNVDLEIVVEWFADVCISQAGLRQA